MMLWLTMIGITVSVVLYKIFVYNAASISLISMGQIR